MLPLCKLLANSHEVDDTNQVGVATEPVNRISVFFLPDDGIARQGERRQNGHEQQPHRRRARQL